MKLTRILKKLGVTVFAFSYLILNSLVSHQPEVAQTASNCTVGFKYFIYTGDYSTQLNKELPDNDPLWIFPTEGERIAVKPGERMRLRARILNNSYSVNRTNFLIRDQETLELNVSGIIERIDGTDTYELITETLPTASGDIKFRDNYNFPYQIDVLFKNPTSGTTTPADVDGLFEIRVHLNDGTDGIDCTSNFYYKVANMDPSPTPQITPTPAATPDVCAKTGDWRDADLTGPSGQTDNTVNINDYTIFQPAFGQKPPANCRLDINRDGVVNVADYSILQFYFGQGQVLTPESPDPGNTGGPVIPPVVTE